MKIKITLELSRVLGLGLALCINAVAFAENTPVENNNSIPSVAVASQGADPFNALIWNRQNFLSGSSNVDRGDWFEWWYYKVVDPATQKTFFFTYGVINPWDVDQTKKGTTSVVQFGDFSQKILLNAVYPVTEFSASYTATDVTIHDHHATDKHISGHVQEDGHDVSWDISIQKQWSFNAMGWTMSVPDISGIYWYPAQASATMNGWLKVDGQTIPLIDAPGYQDRNWGRSFPKWWTWITSNQFKDSPGTVLAVGGGEPKMANAVYLTAGLCIGLFYQGKEYAFRTDDGDLFNYDIKWGTWNLVAKNKLGYKIEISAYAPPDLFLDLPFQSPDGQRFHDYESLHGNLTVRLSRWSVKDLTWQPVTELQTDSAGIEWGSPTPVTGGGEQLSDQQIPK